MAKAKAKSDNKAKSKEEAKDSIVMVSRNRRALHDYEVVESLECGIVLVGSEVKTLRDGHCTLDQSYARVDGGELYLVGCEIPEYSQATAWNHEPKRKRKLLVHRRELAKFALKADQDGFTMVPLALYFKNGKAKVQLAVARGKQSHDKRETVKKAEAKREIDRVMKSRQARSRS